jgi:predicted ribosomally synthesized peptide with SipW-like signal peptide
MIRGGERRLVGAANEGGIDMTATEASARPGAHTATDDAPGEAAKRRRRSRMIRAILAGGLVLGVGTAVTLAAWNDSEFVTGTFTAGRFNLEGSTTDGTTFTDHASSPGGALSFTVPATALSPGATVSAPFAVRLAANTTDAASVTLTTETPTGTVTNLTYTLDIKSAWGCGSSTSSTPISGSALNAGTTTFPLAAGSPVTDPGAPVYLCFTVTAGAGLVQGQTGAAIWKFTATSV